MKQNILFFTGLMAVSAMVFGILWLTAPEESMIFAGGNSGDGLQGWYVYQFITNNMVPYTPEEITARRTVRIVGYSTFAIVAVLIIIIPVPKRWVNRKPKWEPTDMTKKCDHWWEPIMAFVAVVVSVPLLCGIFFVVLKFATVLV